jgi:signal transduction histidine kinase
VLGRLLATVTLLFDKIAIEFLDELPNAITIITIVTLLVIAESFVAVVLWTFNLTSDLWAIVTAVALTAFFTGMPIVGFGQMQYRRARSEFFAARQLTTELILARDEALRATEEKSHFLATASHELRTPLNAIIGFSEIIKDQTLGAMGLPKYVEYARHINQSGAHLLSIINDLLDLSRVESGRSQLIADDNVDLTLAINDCCETVGIVAEKNGVMLNADASFEAICVRADSRMIRQILLNLISNAVKFTPEKGTVTVRARLNPTIGAVIEVADTGIGMTAEEAKIAIKPFGQIQSHHSRKHVGTGLGLPLALAMVELHGGSLHINSVPHEGTTISFTIPKERIV